ncbi:hypothetical protein ISS06_02610 [Patescibacteria group bacterium]|nr:hypothetical protein [Patescibacteria group bacterium]
MTTKKVVADKQKVQFYNKLFELQFRFRKNLLNPDKVLNALQLIIEGHSVKPRSTEWVDEIVEAERRHHFKFFGTNPRLDMFAETIEYYGVKKIVKWGRIGLEPHFLPAIDLSIHNDLPGWKIKPSKWFYSQNKQAKILRRSFDEFIEANALLLGENNGNVVLIDTRCKPNRRRQNKQIYENDNLLGYIISKLRHKNEITPYDKYVPKMSRFGISAREFDESIRPRLAKKIGIAKNQIRLERVIEANIIPQLYSYMPRREDKNTDTFVWHEERFKGNKSIQGFGGSSVYGGLTNIDCQRRVLNRADVSFRPIVEL